MCEPFSSVLMICYFLLDVHQVLPLAQSTISDDNISTRGNAVFGRQLQSSINFELNLGRLRDEKWANTFLTF